MRLIIIHYCLYPVLVHIDYVPLRTLHTGNERKMIMAAHTGIGVFSGESIEWEDYVERLENYFAVYNIKTEAKKRAVLLSECGVTTYKLIKSLIAPQKPNYVEYKVLVEKAKILPLHHCALWSTTSSIHVYSNPVNQ